MKRALVLSGGGEKGAFQVGVIKRLVEQGYRWHHFAGTSVGALNAAFLSQYADSKLGIKNLEKLWLETKTRDVHRWGFLGPLGALFKPYLRDGRPLKKLLEKHFDPEQTRKFNHELRVTAVSLQDLQLRVFDQDYPQISEAVRASAALPGLTPVVLEGHQYVDGGVREVAPIEAAIDMGCDCLDVILCDPAELSLLPKAKNILDVGVACLSAVMQETLRNDLTAVTVYNELKKFNKTKKRMVRVRIHRPAKALPSKVMKFEPAVSEKLISIGYEGSRR